MLKPPVIRPLTPAEWPRYRDTRLRSLADAPDAFCSTLASEQQRSDADWAARLAAAASSGRDHPIVAERDDAIVGLLWAKVNADDAGVVELFQMWVAPEERGSGTGALLLREALAWARRSGARCVRLGVIGTDTAAARLYAREGFHKLGAPVPLRPGSPLTVQDMQHTFTEAGVAP